MALGEVFLSGKRQGAWNVKGLKEWLEFWETCAGIVNQCTDRCERKKKNSMQMRDIIRKVQAEIKAQEVRISLSHKQQ